MGKKLYDDGEESSPNIRIKLVMKNLQKPITLVCARLEQDTVQDTLIFNLRLTLVSNLHGQFLGNSKSQTTLKDLGSYSARVDQGVCLPTHPPL